MHRAKAVSAFIAITVMSSFFGLAIADSGNDQEFYTQSGVVSRSTDQETSDQAQSQEQEASGQYSPEQEPTKVKVSNENSGTPQAVSTESAVTAQSEPASEPVQQAPAAQVATVQEPMIQSEPVQQQAQQLSASQTVPAQEPAPQSEPVQQPVVDSTTAGQPLAAESKESLTIDQPAEVIELKKMNVPSEERPEVVNQLKKIDPNRIGAESSYVTFGGFKPVDYLMKSPALGVGQRVEIYQEPKPVDAYIIMAKEMMHVETANGWNRPGVIYTPSMFRSVVQPLFIRAYGTEFTLSDPNAGNKDESGQIKYTLDYRDVYREYYPKYPAIKVFRWVQHDVLFMHSKKIQPIDWFYTSNLGFRFSSVDDKDLGNNFDSGNENRETYYFNLSLVPNPRFESFSQFEYFKSRHIRCLWTNEPNHFMWAQELRFKSKDMKTSYIGRFSYSTDMYDPFNNNYEKYETSFRVGRDFTKKFNGYTMIKYAYGHTSSNDNDVVSPGLVPVWPTAAPYDVSAAALTWENRVQYMIYDKLWLQGGFDIGEGLNMSNFDNIGWLGGIEYYAPGIIRIDVGWRGNQYYNIDDFLTTVYFKCYLFM